MFAKLIPLSLTLAFGLMVYPGVAQVLAALGEKTQVGRQRTMSERDAVLAWVRRAPFNDMKLMAAEPNFSYDDWFRKGKELPHGIDVLAMLLAEEDLEHPSGDGMRIAYALGWIGDRRPGVTSALVRSIHSKDIALRIESVSALGRLREISAQALLQKLLADPKEDINIRGNACIALGRIGNPDSMPLLQRTSESADDFLSACGKEALRLYKEQGKTQPH